MDGFGDNFDDPEVDPAAEFLAREQDQLAGLEDELKPINSLPIAPLNGSLLASADHTGSFEMINTLAETNGTGFDFSSNHTEIGADVLTATSINKEHVEQILPPEPIQEKPIRRGVRRGNRLERITHESTSPTPLKSAQIREEPEKIKKWREEQKTRLEEKDGNVCGFELLPSNVKSADRSGKMASSSSNSNCVLVVSSDAIEKILCKMSVHNEVETQNKLEKESKNINVYESSNNKAKATKTRLKVTRRITKAARKIHFLTSPRDANEEKKKEEMRVAAKKELEEWYKHHNELIAKNKAANRNAEKQFVADASAIEPGTEWERIAKLCEFNPKSSRTSKDVSRMRSIILQLKQSPLTPKQS